MLKRFIEDKKGISLVEILVGLAIAGIIVTMLGTVIFQGSLLFNKQNVIVDLTNESQVITNQLEQCLMEATGFTLYHEDGTNAKFIYTGEIDHSNNCWKSPTGVERTIIVRENCIYVSGNYLTNVSQVNEGNIITSYVKEFNIDISDSSTEYETDEAGAVVGVSYNNPIVIEIDYTLEAEGRQKEADLVLKLRNYISQCEEGDKPAE